MTPPASITLPYTSRSPVSGAEETIQIQVRYEIGSQKFRFLTQDGWAPCPADLEAEILNDETFRMQLTEAVQDCEAPEDECAPEI